MDTSSTRYASGMKLFANRNYGPSGCVAEEEISEVLRVDSLVDGRRGVTIRIQKDEQHSCPLWVDAAPVAGLFLSEQHTRTSDRSNDKNNSHDHRRNADDARKERSALP
jgi:hypothetical protein